MRNLLNELLDLQAEYDDGEIEVVMVKKMKTYSAAFISFFLTAIVFYGSEALMDVIRNDETFNPVIMAWPDLHDKSLPASVARSVFYLVFWGYMLMLSGVYMVVISVTICISHQYKNLQRYFNNMAQIFEEEISQEDKEKKYEYRFKFGIGLHTKTSWCRRQWQTVGNVVFSSQVVLNVFVLVMMMLQLVNSERGLFALLSSVFTMAAILTSTGLFMLNAGNITLEALEVPTAIYNSGWENCMLSTVRIRKLVVCAMMRGQEPEMLSALGIVPLSYGAYVSIVKSSYSTLRSQ